MEFNWEEFLSNDKIAVHCSTEKQAIDFCKQMHERGLTWRDGQSYLKLTNWKVYKEEIVYGGDGCFASLGHYKNNNYTILEWSDYEKENSMNLESSNLTEEQKKQIIELAKMFEQENEVDKLDYNNDWIAYNMSGGVEQTNCRGRSLSENLFDLGLTAHTKEEAEKIRRRLLVEKELRDWAKKCKDPVDIGNTDQEKYYVQYETDCCEISIDGFYTYVVANILFTDESVLKQAIKSIGRERLIRDYFGIDN